MESDPLLLDQNARMVSFKSLFAHARMVPHTQVGKEKKEEDRTKLFLQEQEMWPAGKSSEAYPALQNSHCDNEGSGLSDPSTCSTLNRELINGSSGSSSSARQRHGVLDQHAMENKQDTHLGVTVEQLREEVVTMQTRISQLELDDGHILHDMHYPHQSPWTEAERNISPLPNPPRPSRPSHSRIRHKFILNALGPSPGKNSRSDRAHHRQLRRLSNSSLHPICQRQYLVL